MVETTPSLFEPIENPSLALGVTHQIEALILGGVLKEGQKLPAERALAEKLNVSRPILREALNQLEKDRLIEVRRGDGSFIATLLGKAMSPALVSLYERHPNAINDHLEYRREQEAFAARLAAERATSADRQLISQLLEQFAQAHEKRDTEASTRTDIEFHRAVVEASHNFTLTHMMSSLYELTWRGVFFNRAQLELVPGTAENILAQHLGIGNAIIHADPKLAAKTAREHIDFIRQSLERLQQEKSRENLTSKRLAQRIAETK